MEPEYKVGDYVRDYRAFYEVTRIEPNTGYGKEEYPYMYYAVQRLDLSGSFGVKVYMPYITSGPKKGKKRKQQEKCFSYHKNVRLVTMEDLDPIFKNANKKIEGFLQSIEDIKEFQRCLSPKQGILSGI